MSVFSDTSAKEVLSINLNRKPFPKVDLNRLEFRWSTGSLPAIAGLTGSPLMTHE